MFGLILAAGGAFAPLLAKTTLNAGEILRVGEMLVSANGRFHVVLQSDGNLVLTRDGSEVIWAAGEARPGNPGYYLAMQNDNNAVIYDPAGKAWWDTGTWDRADLPPGYLVIQDDGNLVAYSGTSVLWDSGTWTGFEVARAEKAAKRARNQALGVKAIQTVINMMSGSSSSSSSLP